MKIKGDKIDGDLKINDTRAPEGAKQNKYGVSLEATVDVKPQELRAVRPFFSMQLLVPQTLPAEAQIVMQELFNCFAKAKEVKEGLIGDIIWGFEQCKIPGQLTVVGLQMLERAGYLKFQAKDNNYIDFSSDKIGGAFVRYQPKLLELVYEGTN